MVSCVHNRLVQSTQIIVALRERERERALNDFVKSNSYYTKKENSDSKDVINE